MDFQLRGGWSVFLTPALFKGQLYIYMSSGVQLTWLSLMFSWVFHTVALSCPWLTTIPPCVYTSFGLSIPPLMDVRAVFTFWLFWIMPLRTVVYRDLSKPLLSILVGIYPEVKLLDHRMVILCLIFFFLRKLLISISKQNCSACWILISQALGLFFFSSFNPSSNCNGHHHLI